MKTNFTISMLRAFFVMFVVVLTSQKLAGQNSYNVSVTNYVYSPAEVTINVGDKVIWKNNGGNHNVNGSKTKFPANPESFGNSLGTGWTYEYTFTTAGTYNYQCDPHAAFGMVGKVIVNPKTVTGLIDQADNSADKIQLFPNPASNFVELKLPRNYQVISSLKVYSISGTLIDQKIPAGNQEAISYNVSRFINGVYFMEINSGTRKNVLKFMKQ